MEVMKRLVLICLLIAAAIQLSAQGTIINGTITDQRGVPIVGPTVCQVNTSNCTMADRNGIFHLLLEPDKEMSLNVKCLGFNPVELTLDETTVYPLKITLTPIYVPPDDTNSDFNSHLAMRSSFNLDALFTDFNQFSSILGSYNTDVMDYFAVIGPELGGSFSRFYAGFGLGMGYSYKDDIDTLVVDLNNTSFNLKLGYDLVNSPRIRLTPLVSLRWLRFRLLNYSNEKKISLSQYLEERDLDLRFNQTIAVAGINLEYLMYNGAYYSSSYWSVGLFGGYAMKLNQKPWIYSRGNRLMTENEIGLKHLTYGISLSFYGSAR